jgi:hypothetical protein
VETLPLVMLLWAVLPLVAALKRPVALAVVLVARRPAQNRAVVVSVAMKSIGLQRVIGLAPLN